MSRIFNDKSLELDINRLQKAIREWAVRRGIWFECGFKSYAEHVAGEPSDIPVVRILYFSSSFQDAIYGELESEFWDLVQSHNFFYEDADGTGIHFYPEEGPRCEAYASYFHWQWICSLLQPDFADVYEELYAHFARAPDDLHRLGWREFEILLARIFQTQGFVTELGPGRGDSSYQPVARRFAARTSGALELYASGDVAEWCRTASDGTVWRAKRSTDEKGRTSYWDGRYLFFAWDGTPAEFDHRD